MLKISNEMSRVVELKLLSIYPLPALLAPLPLIPFTIQEVTGCINEMDKGVNKAPRHLTSCFLLHDLPFQ